MHWIMGNLKNSIEFTPRQQYGYVECRMLHHLCAHCACNASIGFGVYTLHHFWYYILSMQCSLAHSALWFNKLFKTINEPFVVSFIWSSINRVARMPRFLYSLDSTINELLFLRAHLLLFITWHQIRTKCFQSTIPSHNALCMLCTYLNCTFTTIFQSKCLSWSKCD